MKMSSKMNVKYIYKILFLFSLSLIMANSDDSSGGLVEISRDYKVNKNLENTILLDGYISFQACDTQMCVPMFQDISHSVSPNGSVIQNNSINIDLPKVPDWGGLTINGFQDTNDPNKLRYSIQFDIKPGFHIFTTDTVLSPLATGNTDIYWEENIFITEDLDYSEPYPYIEYNELYKQDIGYHDGQKHNQKEVEDSLFAFILIAFVAGILAIFTPCVFPMIPLTVSFFTNKSKSEGQSKIAPFIYGLSIILIFIILGIGCTILLGATALNAMATSATANIVFFIIFFIFALSFFGAFEITLPNSFLNKINKKADQDGMLGIFFMAFTLVLISFSCTAPIVGGILVESTGGNILKPIIGMFSFALPFALIFTLTATFPRLLDKLPKGADNTIKVFLGFIELALSLKFLSKADLTNQWGLLNRDIYLAIWIVIFIFLGLYLIGKIKLYHDSDNQKIGIVRLLFAIVSFSFAVAIFPGMFGAPLSWLSGYLPPPSTQEFDIMDRFDKIESDNYDIMNQINILNKLVKSGNQSLDETFIEFPRKVKHDELKNFKIPFALKGFFDYEEALEFSKKTDKPIFLDFTGFACENCRLMEHNVWSKPHILELLRKDFIIVSLFVDSKYQLKNSEDWIEKEGQVIKQLGKKNLTIQIEKYNNVAQPLYVIIDSQENILSGPIGYCSADKFYQFLKDGLNK